MGKRTSFVKKLYGKTKVAIAAAIVAIPVLTTLPGCSDKARVEKSQKVQMKALPGEWVDLIGRTRQLNISDNGLIEIGTRKRDRGPIYTMFGNVNFTARKFPRRRFNERIRVIRQAPPNLILYNGYAYIKDTDQLRVANSLEEISGKWVGVGEDAPKKGNIELNWDYEKRVRETGMGKICLGPKYREITDDYICNRGQASNEEEEGKKLKITEKFKVGDTYVIMAGRYCTPTFITLHGGTARIQEEFGDGNYKRE